MKAKIEHNLIKRKFKNLIESDANATGPKWDKQRFFFPVNLQDTIHYKCRNLMKFGISSEMFYNYSQCERMKNFTTWNIYFAVSYDWQSLLEYVQRNCSIYVFCYNFWIAINLTALRNLIMNMHTNIFDRNLCSELNSIKFRTFQYNLPLII